MEDAIKVLSNPQISLFLGPRPGKKSFQHLKDLNLTHCCTLLSEREGAALIGKFCKKLTSEDQACEWVWLPVEGGNLETLEQTDLPQHLSKLADAIAGTVAPRIYFHCSAGIHRTGFFVYTLLRLQGLNTEAAFLELAKLRQVTADQVGADRLALADRIVEEILG